MSCRSLRRPGCSSMCGSARPCGRLGRMNLQRRRSTYAVVVVAHALAFARGECMLHIRLSRDPFESESITSSNGPAADSVRGDDDRTTRFPPAICTTRSDRWT
eukprot:14049-Eustigmatos_ZCMA.PRE.1